MSEERLAPTAANLAELEGRRDYLKREVIAWMDAEGMAGRLRFNNQAPCWQDYDAAENAVAQARTATAHDGGGK